MELALVHIARQALARPDAFERLDEIPFEPERKRLTTVHQARDEIVRFVKGAPKNCCQEQDG